MASTPWRSTILQIIIPPVLTVILFAYGAFFLAIPSFEKNLMSGKREMIREITSSVISLLENYQEEVENGSMSLDEAQQMAIKQISHLRYGPESKDYFWINDMEPVMIMHPFRPDLDGHDISNFTDPRGKHLFVEFVKTVKKNGSGYVEYMWQWKDNPNLIVPKLSYVQGFKPWGWIIGTGIYIEDTRAMISKITRGIHIFFISIVLIVSMLSVYIIWYSLGIEKKRAKFQNELAKANNYISNIINSMPSILIGVDSDMVITHWNIQAETATGINSEDAVNSKLIKKMERLSDEISLVRDALKYREIRTTQIQVSQTEENNRYEDVTVYPLIANGVEGAVIRMDDVTDRVRLEELIVQSEKMMSLGGMAAGIAHEINNPLAGMIQTANVLNDRLSDLNIPANRREAEKAGTSMEAIKSYMNNRGVLDMVQRIRSSGARAAEIIQNMLSFARDNDLAFSSRDLTKLLDQCVELAGSDYDLKKKYDFRKIEIIREYSEDVPPVPCSAGKIQQVFLNILRNGAEAMREKENAERSPAFILRSYYEKTSGMVCIEIEDNGPGMDENTCKRIFEPFYTTKSPGRGTGLGLSVSYFIIAENHNGKMEVESIPKVGTKFIIKLPVSSSKNQ